MTATASARTWTKAMSEENLLSCVLDLARLLGLRTAHFRPALTDKGWRTPVAGDGKGWPDLIIVGSRLIVRELKAERGNTTAEQVAWFAALRAAGVDVAIWKPNDWLSGQVRAELETIR